MAHDLAKYGDQRLVYHSVVLVCGTETWALYVCLCVYACVCVNTLKGIFSMFLPGCKLTC